MKVREPVARPLDVVAVELLLTAAQAFLAGVLLYLAVGFWQDLGVGLGTVAAVLLLMGLAVGASWLYWLLGGVGWPMAAANAPASLLFGFLLILSWVGEEQFRVSGAPLLLAELAAVFGIVAGVFLDSPRRWRWDQRQKLRPGTTVPRVSHTTVALAASVPRTLPRRAGGDEGVSELASRIEHSTPTAPPPGGDTGIPSPRSDGAESEESRHSSDPAPAVESDTGSETKEAGTELTEAPEVGGSKLEVPEAPEPTLPTARLSRGAAGGGSTAHTAVLPADEDGIELPTMVEPRAQRSPWAWAAPPEWSRDDEDDVPPTSKRP